MKTKSRIHVWCENVGGGPAWFTAAYSGPQNGHPAFVTPREFVSIHFRKPEVSHYSGRGEPNAELLAAALEYQRLHRECLNT